MSSIAMQGGATGTGAVTLLAPSTSTDRILTLPDATGTVLSTASTSVVTPAMLTQPLTLGTAVPTTSGTSIDFTGIPSWAKRVTVMFSGVSTSGASYWLIQLGAGSVTSSGYVSVASASGSTNSAYSTTSTAGFVMATGNAAFNVYATATICLVSGNTWVCSHSGGASTFYGMSGGGGIALGGTLDRIRITTVNGTDTFDAGSINIMYEG